MSEHKIVYREHLDSSGVFEAGAECSCGWRAEFWPRSQFWLYEALAEVPGLATIKLWHDEMVAP